MTEAVLGVDPGNHGAVSLLSGEGKVLYIRAFWPEMTRADLKAVFDVAAGTLKLYGGRSAFLEKVGYIGRRKGHEKGDGGKGAFTFGRGYGRLEMVLESHGLTVYDTPPMMWQGSLGCLTGGDKNVTKRKAQELFPAEKITHAIADSLLIAEFGRRTLGKR